jgi:hypothetical protein
MTQLYLTDAGVQAMMAAQTNGLALQLQGFILGSAYNYSFSPSTLYPPVSGVPYSNTSQTTIKGTQVYPTPPTTSAGQINTAPISNYHLQADGVTGAFSVILGLTLGNFSFGEIAVVMPNGTVFGIANLQNLQPKTATVAGATGNIVQISLTFQANGTIPVIQLNNSTPTQAVLATTQVVDNVSGGPSAQTVNTLLSLNQDEFSRATELVEQDANDWQSSQYDWQIYSGTVPTGTNSDKTFVDPNVGNIAVFQQVVGRWMIRFTSGAVRGQLRQLTPAPLWSQGAVYKLGYIVQAASVSNPNAYYYCTTAGTAGTTEPTWPTVSGNTVTDGSVVWTYNPGNVNPNNSLIWNGSTGATALAGITYQLLRASSFTGLNRYLEEYMLFRQYQAYWHFHD